MQPHKIATWAEVEDRRPIGVLVSNVDLVIVRFDDNHSVLDVWQTSLHNPDFARFAENCGARGFRVERADELGPALADALADDGPSLVDIAADPALV